MAPFNPDESLLKDLEGKVIVVVGAAEGVAYALVEQMHALGAHMVLGDAQKSEKSPFTLKSDSTARVDRVEVDPSNYSDLRDLARKAFHIHGRIDHAIYCLNVNDDKSVYGKEYTIDNLESAPDLLPIELNLKGAIYFARIALAYLNHELQDQDRSITFLSSDVTFYGVPFVPLWQISLSGIITLMKTLRPFASTQSNAPVRINVACPGLPAYPHLDQSLVQAWKKVGLVVNTPETVARLICHITAQKTIYNNNCVPRQLHGCVILATGDRYQEIDETMQMNIEAVVGPESWETITGTRALYRRLNLPLWRMSDDA